MIQLLFHLCLCVWCVCMCGVLGGTPAVTVCQCTLIGQCECHRLLQHSSLSGTCPHSVYRSISPHNRPTPIHLMQVCCWWSLLPFLPYPSLTPPLHSPSSPLHSSSSDAAALLGWSSPLPSPPTHERVEAVGQLSEGGASKIRSGAAPQEIQSEDSGSGNGAGAIA